MTSFLDLYLQYHNMRSSPGTELFAKHLCIQQIGHTLGRDASCRVRPDAVRHNSYLCGLGPSGNSLKSTSQEQILKPLTPTKYLGPSSFSPQGLLRYLEDTPNTICHMGEFSTVLRGIKMGGNMADFKEISNELWDCPNIYDKRLTNKENSYTVKWGYLSISTTCTEEEFYENLKPEMVHGGFLPRWLFVPCPKVKKSREDLPDNVDSYKRLFLNIFNQMYKFFGAHNIKFRLDDDAKVLCYDILDKLESAEKYEKIQPFVSRYQRYIVSYADILTISELIGDMLEKEYELSEISEIVEINKINEIVNGIISKMQKALPIVTIPIISVKATTIKQAFLLIKPCLKYATEIVNYIDEDFIIAKLKRVIDKVEGKEQRNRILQKTNLTVDKFKIGERTLLERGEIEWEHVTKGEGRAKKTTIYIVKTKEYR